MMKLSSAARKNIEKDFARVKEWMSGRKVDRKRLNASLERCLLFFAEFDPLRVENQGEKE